MKIGCIGQGFIGGNYADTFETHGHTVVRYAFEEPYVQNGDAIADCDVVFIAVPTPTTTDGFDASAVESALTKVGKGKIGVIKSTVLPGTTNALQDAFPDKIVLFSPEFLREKTAALDAAHPTRNIVGIPHESKMYRDAAERVMALLPEAPFSRIMRAKEAELVKYAGNTFLTLKVVYANLLYDLCKTIGAEYDVIYDSLGADVRIGPSHLGIVDASGHPGSEPGRGAGGHCFIKDLAAFSTFYANETHDEKGTAILRSIEAKNSELLRASGKDVELLDAVYGADQTTSHRKTTDVDSMLHRYNTHELARH